MYNYLYYVCFVGNYNLLFFHNSLTGFIIFYLIFPYFTPNVNYFQCLIHNFNNFIAININADFSLIYLKVINYNIKILISIINIYKILIILKIKNDWKYHLWIIRISRIDFNFLGIIFYITIFMMKLQFTGIVLSWLSELSEFIPCIFHLLVFNTIIWIIRIHWVFHQIIN